MQCLVLELSLLLLALCDVTGKGAVVFIAVELEIVGAHLHSKQPAVLGLMTGFDCQGPLSLQGSPVLGPRLRC